MQPSIVIRDDESSSSPNNNIVFNSSKLAQSPSPSPGIKDSENPFQMCRSNEKNAREEGEPYRFLRLFKLV